MAARTAVGVKTVVAYRTGFDIDWTPPQDLDLDRVNPMLLLGLLRRPEVAAVPIMLLHCYPYHREARYLAQSFNNVYFDVGLALSHVGARAKASWRSRWNWRRSPNCSTPPTPGAPPNSTIWGHICGGTRSPTSPEAGCPRGTGRPPTPNESSP